MLGKLSALPPLASWRTIWFGAGMVFRSVHWRARRSVLFVPASNVRALQKASGLSCDCVILDLEDSVGRVEANSARLNLADFVRQPRQECVVRVSAFGTPSFAPDLAAALALHPDAILLPKLESASVLEKVAAGMPPERPALWAMIETPAALLQLGNIVSVAQATGLSALVVGPNDLARSTGVPIAPGRAAFIPWFMAIIAAARSAQLCVLDGVFNAYGDSAGFAAACTQAAQLGFDGKTLIHPLQIEPANAAFSPDEAAIARARRIVTAYDLPANQFSGVVGIDGEMVERLHLDAARDLLEYVQMCRL